MNKEQEEEAEHDTETTAERVVKHNEKFNVPQQTEQEEAETYENAETENLADNREIKRRKRGL